MIEYCEGINVEFAKELVEWMRKRAKRLPTGGECRLMPNWSRELEGCGTVGCISGEAVLLAQSKGLIKPTDADFLYGERWLGLGAEQLFSWGNWPDEFKEEYTFYYQPNPQAEMLLMADVLEDAVRKAEAKAEVANAGR